MSPLKAHLRPAPSVPGPAGVHGRVCWLYSGLKPSQLYRIIRATLYGTSLHFCNVAQPSNQRLSGQMHVFAGELPALKSCAIRGLLRSGRGMTVGSAEEWDITGLTAFDAARRTYVAAIVNLAVPLHAGAWADVRRLRGCWHSGSPPTLARFSTLYGPPLDGCCAEPIATAKTIAPATIEANRGILGFLKEGFYTGSRVMFRSSVQRWP